MPQKPGSPLWLQSYDSCEISGIALWSVSLGPMVAVQGVASDSRANVGQLVAVDPCAAPLWSVSARSAPLADERWYVAKLAP